MENITEVDRITREQMEQYEAVRQSGLTNMFDYNQVVYIAEQSDMEELANTSIEEYGIIISNFSNLMKKFGIVQR